MTLSSLRRRWPEAALVALLAIVAAFTGLAWRSGAIALIGGVAVFAIRRRIGDLFRGAGIAAGILLVTLVVTFTIDLGYVFGGVIKGYAEAEGSKFLERPLHLGRLGIQIARGRFVVEDLRIEGLRKGDAPWLAAKTITVDFPWWQVFNTREFFIRSVVMTDWTMQIEKFQQGNSMPNLKRKSKTPPGPKRFTTTVQYLHAYRGQFTFVGHGSWTTVARNLDIRVGHDTGEYLGTATITDGTVRIKDYEPMRADMRVRFKVDGSLLRLPEIDLYTDGAHSLRDGGSGLRAPVAADDLPRRLAGRPLADARDLLRERVVAQPRRGALQGRLPPVPRRARAEGRLHERRRLRERVRVPGPSRLARLGTAPFRGDERVGPVLRRRGVVPVPDRADLRADAGGRAVRRELPRRRSRAAL